MTNDRLLTRGIPLLSKSVSQSIGFIELNGFGRSRLFVICHLSFVISFGRVFQAHQKKPSAMKNMNRERNWPPVNGPGNEPTDTSLARTRVQDILCLRE